MPKNVLPMDLATGYKMTEVGIIPENWEVKTFKDVFNFLPTNTYARDCMNDVEGEVQNIHYGDVLIKYGSILDFTKDQIPYLNPSQTKYNSRGQLQDGDIIFADTAEDETVGKAVEVYSIGSQKAVSGLHTMLCRPKEGLFEPRFLGYFLNSSCYHNQLLPLMVGTKVSSVSKSAIIDTLILLPPKEEQKKISDAFAEYDAMLASLESKISKKKQIKEGSMQQLLTGKKRLPGFTGEWKDCTLKDVGVFVGGSGFPLTYQGLKEGNLPFYKVSDFNNPGNDTFMNVANNYISKDTAKILGCHIIPKGSIVFAKIGAALMLERKRVTNFDCCIDNNMMALCPYSDCDSVFLQNILLRIKLSDYAEVTALPSLKQSSLEKIELCIPSKEEQSAIANLLSDMDAEIQGLEAERNKYLLIKQGMMQDLLTGKTRLI